MKISGIVLLIKYIFLVKCLLFGKECLKYERVWKSDVKQWGDRK